MKDWLTDEEAAQQAEKDAKRANGRGRLNPDIVDNIAVGLGGLVYAAALGWPLSNLATGYGSRPENFALLGGMIGLMLAAYAVMSNRLAQPVRLPIGAIGLTIVVVCWGFGPL